LAPVFFGLFGLEENKANDADTQEAKINEYRRDINRYENDLRGPYIIGEAIYGQPQREHCFMIPNYRSIRLLKIATVILLWYGLGQVALSIVLRKPVEAIIMFFVVATLFFILINGRLFEKLRNRRVRGVFLVPMYLLIATLVSDVIRAFQHNDLYVLDQLHVFGLIVYIISGGIIISIAILLWETLSLTRDYFASKN